MKVRRIVVMIICKNANFFIGCIYPCQAGHAPNAACDGCDLTDICVADNPCLNDGSCELEGSPSDYTCNCTGYYTGDICQSMKLNFAQYLMLILHCSV